MSQQESWYQEAYHSYVARYKEMIEKRVLALVISSYIFILLLPVSCAFAYYIWEHGAHIK